VERAHQRSMVRLYRRLARLDSGRLRLHHFSVDHGADRQGIRRTAHGGDRGVYHHPVASFGRCHGSGLDGGPDGAQGATDDIHPLVLGLQLHRWLFAHLRIPVFLSRDPWHWHGSGMARGRGARHGILADTVPQLHERRPARLLGSRFRAIGFGLWLPVRSDRLARLAVDRHPAGLCRDLGTHLRERAGRLVENQRQQREKQVQVRAPLFSIFKPAVLFNTLTAVLWMAAAFCVYYSIWALFSSYLQKELHWTPLMVATPLFWANIVVFVGSGLWGIVADRWGRRPAIIIPAVIAVLITPLYLMTTDPLWIISGFIVQGMFGGAIYGQNPSYLSERFPTEVRATASGFVYHQGAIWGGLVAPVLTYFAVQMNMGFAIPMLIGTTVSLLVVIFAVFLGPETRGKHLVADLEILEAAEFP